MSKPDTPSGLFAKVVKFVRNPATSWSELDNKEPDHDEALSKQLLKEMIERKRRNDFVRKREFDMLRKMRKRDAMLGQDPSARPSFSQSSITSKPYDRASTLKKIDEIEAQMSMQWWETKPGTSNTDSINRSAYPLSVNPTITRPPLGTSPASSQALPVDCAATDPVSLQARAELEVKKASAARPASGDMLAFTVPSGFSPSRMVAMNVSAVAQDAELEEASIRFANGDDAGAEAGLIEMLSPKGSRAGHSETWMTLFDLYRATGQQDKFETTAIRFVELFNRSAPQWFSMPDMVRQLATQEKGAGNGFVADWICPSAVGVQSIAALKAALAKAPMPWHLDWRNLKTMDVTAVEPLCKVFNSWSAQPVQLRFMGAAQLHQVLQNATPSSQQETPQAWWQLRMEALRVTHRPDEFELVALDFCVTYEISPPAWESARCDYKPLDQDGDAVGGHGDVDRDSMPSILSALYGDTQMDGMSSQIGNNLISIELSGQIQGDAIAVLDQLEAKLMGADIMHISCAKLIRVDFSAASTLLNWVSARQAESRSVQFSDVNRLVAAFFKVIGITECARVVTRVD